MRPRLFVAVMGLVIVAGMVCPDLCPVHAGGQPSSSGYKVLEPIRHGSLTVFPVVAPKSYATDEFLTLDEGLRSGEVVVTEYGNIRGLLRRRTTSAMHHDTAEVNRLVLINNSKRPLVLLAGEIVTGGKQDRVIGKDRIVPAESDPVDLSVFCVEPGRWVATSDQFGASGTTYASGLGSGSSSGGSVGGPIQKSAGTLMAQPSVRARAMGDKDSERGVGRGEEAAAIHDGRGSGRTFGRERRRDTIHEFVCPGNGEQRSERKSRRGCQAYRTELSELDQTTA